MRDLTVFATEMLGEDINTMANRLLDPDFYLFYYQMDAGTMKSDSYDNKGPWVFL